MAHTNGTTGTGCKGCGMAYSFFFGVQFHKAGCTEAPKASVPRPA